MARGDHEAGGHNGRHTGQDDLAHSPGSSGLTRLIIV